MGTLAQQEVDDLLALPKYREDGHVWRMQNVRRLAIPLFSAKREERFLLDLRYSRMELVRGTYQNRARETFVLARLDIGGPPHRNPDGDAIDCPHLHYYREGYRDSAWARPVAAELAGLSLAQAYSWFMRHCNVVEPPLIDGGLFAWATGSQN